MVDMLSDKAAVRLTTLVAEIEAEAYARGKADARTEVLALLGAAGKPARRPRPENPPAPQPARKRRAGGGGRAPKGAVHALVERALRARPGLNAQEILDSADTDAERLVKPSSIGVELTKGRRQGRYEATDGRWSLAASSPADGGGTPDAPTPVEGDTGAGAPADASMSETGQSAEPHETATAPAGEKPGVDAASTQPEIRGDGSRLGMNW